ncbi:MAG: iron-sulfur cluster assembly scaffold protein [bacterium]|nr:iron-sulfur cluster assembly scaffold protein [bacterium]
MNEEYPQVYLDHFQQPRYVGVLEPCSHRAALTTNHPGCHDQLELYLRIVDDVIEDIRFRGRLCSGSLAAASLLCTKLHRQSVSVAQSITEQDLRIEWGVVPPGKEHSLKLVIDTLQLAIKSPE